VNEEEICTLDRNQLSVKHEETSFLRIDIFVDNNKNREFEAH